MIWGEFPLPVACRYAIQRCMMSCELSCAAPKVHLQCIRASVHYYYGSRIGPGRGVYQNEKERSNDSFTTTSWCLSSEFQG